MTNGKNYVVQIQTATGRVVEYRVAADTDERACSKAISMAKEDGLESPLAIRAS